MSKFYITATQAQSMVAALSHCMSKEATRYYLNGICIEHTERGGLVAVATDGHRLGSMKLSPMQVDAQSAARIEGEFSYIITREAVEWIAGLPKKFTSPHLITFEFTAATVKLSLFPTMISAEFGLIDGNFPDWRRVMQAEHTPSISFNAEYIKQLAMALKKAGDARTTAITFSLTDIGAPAIITSGQEGLQFVLMPMREYATARHTNAHVAIPAPEENPMVKEGKKRKSA